MCLDRSGERYRDSVTSTNFPAGIGGWNDKIPELKGSLDLQQVLWEGTVTNLSVICLL